MSPREGSFTSDWPTSVASGIRHIATPFWNETGRPVKKSTRRELPDESNGERSTSLIVTSASTSGAVLFTTSKKPGQNLNMESGI